MNDENAKCFLGPRACVRNGYSTGFKCNDGQCIDANYVCDRRADCRAAEDEKICKYKWKM